MNTETLDARLMDKLEAMVPISIQERTSLLGGSGGLHYGKPDRPRAEVLERVLVRVVERVAPRLAALDEICKQVGMTEGDVTCIKGMLTFPDGSQLAVKDGDHWNPDSHWENHPDYPRTDWAYEVDNEDTTLGYKDWVNHQLEEASHESG